MERRDQLVREEAEHDGAPRASARLADAPYLGARAGKLRPLVALAEARDPLHHAASLVVQHLREREQLLVGRIRAGDGDTLRCRVARGARGREAERARRERRGDLGAHLDQLGRRRRAAFLGGGCAERELAERRVAHQARRVHAERARGQRVEVAAVAPPAERHAGEDALGRDLFDGLERAREPLLVAGLHRREGHAAVAHHHRGDAVPAAGARERIPEELRVEVRVRVDEAGRHQAAGGVDRPPAALRHRPDRDDAVAFDRDVGGEGRPARAVHHAAVADDQVVHVRPLRLRRRRDP